MLAIYWGLHIAAVGGFVGAVYVILASHMRRAERARTFLDVLDATLKEGRPTEESLLSIAASRDLSMGVRFYILTEWLKQGLPLSEALAKSPRFLPPQVTAMLQAGRAMGNLQKVLPACRQLLKDAISQTQSAINYLVILTFVVTPGGIFVAWVLNVVVLPKFREIGFGFGVGGNNPGLLFIMEHFPMFIVIQTILLLVLWLATLAYISGPQIGSWFPVLQRFQYWVPWRRKRMQRDFSTMLAILIDAGVSEAEALELAANCTVNTSFYRRARRAVAQLKQGAKLTEAVETIDDSGEFAWRLANAVHGGGFLRALAGWHESLDAKAFQEEQATAQGITTALVLWTGIFVGAIVITVFGFLVSIINTGVLW